MFTVQFLYVQIKFLKVHTKMWDEEETVKNRYFLPPSLQLRDHPTPVLYSHIHGYIDCMCLRVGGGGRLYVTDELKKRQMKRLW